MSDDKLVKRGELVLLIGEEEAPEEELKRMNRGKVGRPFTCVDSLIWTLVMLRVCLRLPYRQLTGFARRLARILGFRLVYRRIRRLAEGRGLPDVRVEPGRRVVASVDSTGLKVGNPRRVDEAQVEEAAGLR
ncbi:MAG: transposase [Candidatus Freyarchaeota archaeon]